MEQPASSSASSSSKRKAPEQNQEVVTPESVADKDDTMEDEVINAAVASQIELVKKRKKVDFGTKAGCVPAYVHATGSVVGPMAANAPSAARAKAPKLGNTVCVKMAHGAHWPENVSARFRLTMDFASADVLMVANISEGLYLPEALEARLRGVRVCDRDFIQTAMQKGNCYAFQRALDLHFHLYLTEGFANKYPAHSDVLFAHGALNGCKLRVYKGGMPEKPRHPKLTFNLCPSPSLSSDSDSAESGKSWNLDKLLMKLGVLYDQG